MNVGRNIIDTGEVSNNPHFSMMNSTCGPGPIFWRKSFSASWPIRPKALGLTEMRGGWKIRDPGIAPFFGLPCDMVN